ncbi:GntR family transcriptional regulator [Teredinibacter franksiae]|uniref:GntR family transcriptional regulator n=1 Tax=Teredinibacter franksiae TaxID=2761453 RepID=UPI0016289E87|nr:GntR family transcriptional regulator [Teredinibacter franksiae]
MTISSPDSPVEKSQPIAFDRSTPDQLFEYIRDEIVGMVLVPGAKIPENQLAKKFGVSRTPVRAALQRLSDLGFVEIRPQRGTFVTKLSMQLMLEARFLREALEVAATNHLTKNPDDQVLLECENIIQQQEQAAEREDPIAFQHLDDKFHRALALSTGFVRVAKELEAEKSRMDRVRNLSLVELTGQYTHIINQHKAILAGIKSGSEDDAKAAMEAHMRDVFNILRIAPEKYPEYFE